MNDGFQDTTMMAGFGADDTVTVRSAAPAESRASRPLSIICMILGFTSLGVLLAAAVRPDDDPTSWWQTIGGLCLLGSPFGVAALAAIAAAKIPTRHEDLRKGAIGLAILLGFFSIILMFAFMLDTYPD